MKFPELRKFQTIEGRYKNKIEGKALSFLKGCLTMSPHTRLTAEECLCHEYFEDLRVNDPTLKDLNEAYEQGRVGGMKLIDMEDTRRHNSMKIASTNKIRIKTISDNMIPDTYKRKSVVSSLEDPKVSSMKFSDEGLNYSSKNSPKTHYNNILENKQPQNINIHNTGFDESNYFKQNLWRKKNYPVYTQLAFHSNNKDAKHEDLRKKVSNQVRRQNPNQSQRFKFETNANGFKSSTNSLSQINRKYNFATSTKFASRDKKEKLGGLSGG